MSIICDCNAGLGNTGRPGCFPIAAVAKILVLQSMKKDDGTLNFIDTTAAPYDQTFFDAQINNADPFERWYPTPELKNIVDERGDPITETFEDATIVKIQNGARTFVSFAPGMTPEFLDSISGNGCVDLGAYVFDKSRNIIGNGRDAEKLYPIRIDRNTWDVRLVKGTDTTIQKVALNFQWSQLERDEDIRMITPNNFAAGVDILVLEGLLDVNVTYSAISTTGFRATLKTNWGDQVNPIGVPGLIQTDFSLAEITPVPGAVTILTFDEVAGLDGVYDFTFGAETPGDVLRLTPVQNGFDFAVVAVTDILIP